MSTIWSWQCLATNRCLIIIHFFPSSSDFTMGGRAHVLGTDYLGKKVNSFCKGAHSDSLEPSLAQNLPLYTGVLRK